MAHVFVLGLGHVVEWGDFIWESLVLDVELGDSCVYGYVEI